MRSPLKAEFKEVMKILLGASSYPGFRFYYMPVTNTFEAIDRNNLLRPFPAEFDGKEPLQVVYYGSITSRKSGALVHITDQNGMAAVDADPVPVSLDYSTRHIFASASVPNGNSAMFTGYCLGIFPIGDQPAT